MAGDPVDALAAEAERTGAFLKGLAPGDWTKPTRCAPLDVRELAVHALRGGYRVLDSLAAPRVDGEAEKDAVTYWDYDPAVVGTGVVDRAKQESQARAPDADIAAEWLGCWARAIDAARAALDDDPLIPALPGMTRLSEFLKTRCIEVCIHTMDLRDALGLAPDPDPECLEVVCDILRGILGTDLRPRGVDEVHFALAATGRESLTDDERTMLGPLAEQFPLLQ